MIGIFLTGMALLAMPAFAEETRPVPEIMNMSEISAHLHLQDFAKSHFTDKVKIAILDNGFNGYESEIGKRLPANTVYHDGKASDADHANKSSYHGLFLAELIVKIIENAEAKSGEKVNYDLHLYNAFGYTKFADAVENVVADGVDVVLYSQVWEYAGNGDGKGEINFMVDAAIRNNVLWINAAGNFGRRMRRAPVTAEGEWVKFADKPNEGVRIQCQAAKGEQCPLRLILAWNSFPNDPDAGTDKDLDLYLYDKDGNQTAVSDLKQVLEFPEDKRGYTKLPREQILKPIDPGWYTARVKITSDNFTERDELRLTATGEGIVLDKPTLEETLLPPADNPGAIVVGASDDVQTSRSRQTHRPDVSLLSTVVLKDYSQPFSTSVAAAMAAGVTVLNLASGMERRRDTALARLEGIANKPVPTPVVNDNPPPAQPQPVRARPRPRPRHPDWPLDAYGIPTDPSRPPPGLPDVYLRPPPAPCGGCQ